MEGEKKKPRAILYVLVGAAFLACIPLAMKWADMRVEDPATRLRREKVEITSAIVAMAKNDGAKVNYALVERWVLTFGSSGGG